jgi:hypothetical protein
MATSIPGEIADTLVGVLESAPVQSALSSAISSGELTIEKVADAAINNAKGSGVLGLVIASAKGAVETEFNAELQSLPASTILAIITKAAQAEAKNLGG